MVHQPRQRVCKFDGLVWAAAMVLVTVCAGSLPAQRVILSEDFEADLPDAFPSSADMYGRSTVASNPDLDPSTAAVTGGAFADPFDPGNNQSLILHNPEGTTQMAVTWIDEFEDDPATFRNGSIEFDLYMDSPDPAAFWTFMGLRIGYGDEDRTGVSTFGDTTLWQTYRMQNCGDYMCQQVVANDVYLNTGAFDILNDHADPGLFDPDRAMKIRYDIDGSGTTFVDPPSYTLTIDDQLVTWNDEEEDNAWVVNSTTFEFAPGINVLSFFTDASAISTGTASGTGNVYIDNLVITNNDLEPLAADNNGDYNGDGTVNAADYTVWVDTLGDSVESGTGADGNSDGVVGPDDYQVWVANFGTTAATAGAQSVPEPSCLILLLLTGLLSAAKGFRYR